MYEVPPLTFTPSTLLPAPSSPTQGVQETPSLVRGGIPHPPILLLAGGPNQRPSPDSQAAERAPHTFFKVFLEVPPLGTLLILKPGELRLPVLWSLDSEGHWDKGESPWAATGGREPRPWWGVKLGGCFWDLAVGR